MSEHTPATQNQDSSQYVEYTQWFDTNSIAWDTLPTKVAGQCGECDEHLEAKTTSEFFQVLEEHRSGHHA